MQTYIHVTQECSAQLSELTPGNSHLENAVSTSIYSWESSCMRG